MQINGSTWIADSMATMAATSLWITVASQAGAVVGITKCGGMT